MRRTAAPPPHTRQAIDELNYIPNAAARELRRTTSNKIGLVLPDLVDPYYNGILRGVLRQIRSGDYILNIAFSDQNAKEERKKIGELINANVAGLLIVTCQPDNREFFQSRGIKSGPPSVFVHQKPNFDANYIGYAPIPGHLALQAGRNLAIFKNSVHKQQVYDYFKWIFEAPPAATTPFWAVNPACGSPMRTARSSVSTPGWSWPSDQSPLPQPQCSPDAEHDHHDPH